MLKGSVFGTGREGGVLCVYGGGGGVIIPVTLRDHVARQLYVQTT